MIDTSDACNYVDSIVVYRGRSHFLRRDDQGFYVDLAKAVKLGSYRPTGNIRRLQPGEGVVVHNRETIHFTIPR